MARANFLQALTASLMGGLACVLVSCGGGSGGNADALGGAVQKKKELDDFQYSKTDIVYGKAGSDTEGMIVGGRRSQFEGKSQVVFGGQFAGKSYQTSKFKSQSWTGKKDYGRKTFGGNTDASQFKVASAMDGQAARGTNKRSAFSGQTLDTATYNAPTAREASAAGVTRKSSAFANERYPMPRIMSERDYQKMTIQETNRLLGRDR